MEQVKKDIYFWGCKLNDEELKKHRLSYATVSKHFDAILCNNIVEVDESIFNNIESGDLSRYYNKDDEEITQEEYYTLEEQGEEVREESIEIYQWYIVDNKALWYLKKMNELVLYSTLLDCYIWGVDHWGTCWDYVLTSFKLNQDYSSIINDEE